MASLHCAWHGVPASYATAALRNGLDLRLRSTFRVPPFMNLVYCLCYNASKWLAKVLFHYRAYYPERIPKEGGFIMAVNHASYFDPPLAGVASDRKLFYLARRSLMDRPFFAWLLPRLNVIPVDLHGNDRSALKTLIHKIKEGEGVILFPEGTRSLDGQLQHGRPGIGLIVAKTRVPVVPARIFGAHEAFPRGARGIRPSQISVVIGKPLDLSSLAEQGSGREIYQKISDVIMEEIAKLKLP